MYSNANFKEKFSKFLDNFFTMESIEWNNINDLKSDEILGIISLYESFVSRIDDMYPISRERSERGYRKLSMRNSDRSIHMKRMKEYKFDHHFLPFHKILEDRLVFFKSIKKAIESWDKKKFRIALKDYKLIYDFFIDMNEILDEIDLRESNSHFYKIAPSLKYKRVGILPMQLSRSRGPCKYAIGFSNDDRENKNFKKLINLVNTRLDDLNSLFPYREFIEEFNANIKVKSYNRAFDNYLKAEYCKNKIEHSHLGHFGTLEKEEKFKEKFTVVLLILTNKIRRVVLDLGTKYSKLEIKEIKEKCDVESTDLMVEVIKKMIRNHEIYAEYFSSSNSIAFNQQTNSKEIDNLMKKYELWEKEEKRKI